ncbi:MAG TPA: cytidylyltransferase domain-containing protein [Candidatus Wunengus sp. YC65]|uniref:cytidylyltransferase domain-containing protein n=1 Tax=Candidatus Wunengus sp. YC65 TaxID=3367701 RepID=UPI0040297721
MKSAIFITVRSDSSRLPNKALLPIIGKPTIEMVIIRAKMVRNVDSVVVCTTERPVDDSIVQIAEKCGVLYYRGNLEDKLDRWLGAANKFGIDAFVTMDGDDLLCDPELMELGVNQLSMTDVDFIEAPQGLICGSFTYGIRTTALEKVCSIKDTTDTEMMWVYFKDSGLFKVSILKVTDPVFYDPDIRMTLDYVEDLAFFNAIFTHFDCVNNDLPLKVIIPYLKNNPEVIKINAFRHRDWSTNQQKKTRLILKDT